MVGLDPKTLFQADPYIKKAFVEKSTLRKPPYAYQQIIIQ